MSFSGSSTSFQPEQSHNSQSSQGSQGSSHYDRYNNRSYRNDQNGRYNYRDHHGHRDHHSHHERGRTDRNDRYGRSGRREEQNDWGVQRHTNWIFNSLEFYETPSLRDSVTLQDELSMRAKGVVFLNFVGMHLRLPQPTLYVASTLFHRFYMRFSIKKHHYYDIGATSIFLATKLEETGRKLKDIVIACCRVAQKNDKLEIDEQSKEYWRWRDLILFNEELLLEAICFDLSIENPYNILVQYTRRFVKGEKERLTLTKSAWAFVNDSTRSTLCLRYHARVIAAAALYCASRITHIDIKDSYGRTWWQEIDVDITDIIDGCNTMADMYDNNGSLAKGGQQKYARVPPVEQTPAAP
ncbi:cyclin-like protein [Lipomyces arxii]|uniref:cyclin-like protein n=1 Tax=Lipomyces arxii TaxID=56418 RepID=UPI0034CE986E